MLKVKACMRFAYSKKKKDAKTKQATDTYPPTVRRFELDVLYSDCFQDN